MVKRKQKLFQVMTGRLMESILEGWKDHEPHSPVLGRMMEKLDPDFTFENFVVGPANRLAAAAARRAAERPGVSYNPLFIHASSGLGKTHILSAVARHAARVAPDKRVEYQTAIEFLQELAQSSDGAREEGVRERCSGLDILVMDDLHLLSTQPEVQALLLLTLDTLIGDGKQVVLASDRPPAEMDGMEAHLRARLEAGLLVTIGPPEYETRVAIIKKWIEARLQLLEPGVADAVGRYPFQAVTELRAVLDRILVIQEEEDRTVKPEEARAIVERGNTDGPAPEGSELGEFLGQLSGTVAAKVQAQEAPWRRLLRELAEEVEADDFKANRLRRQIEEEAAPQDLDGLLREFKGRVRRLKAIRVALDAAGNPWPEAAYGVLRDPERLNEAEALLASAKERARPFPSIPPGPVLKEIGGALPQLVIRAADQLVNTDRPEYNPLYVWSPDGVAARALLQAAGRSKLLGEGGGAIALTSVSEFAEDFIRSLSQGVAGAWRERCWSVDLLLIDGAQDLSATERAQEEFFHLFEALQRRRARVMIAADRPPSKISALDDRLRGRLEGGLVVEIEVEASKLSPDLRESLEKAAPRNPAPAAEEKDISDEDREWIRSFQPRESGGQGPSVGTGGGKDGGLSDGLAVRGDVPKPEEIWAPSREQVVWEWPRLDDLIVEVLD